MSSNPADDIKKLDDWANTLIASLAPRERQKLFKRMGQHLRRANKKRITAQTGPDGRRWIRRKKQSQRGPGARAKMFLGLRKARHMRLTTSAQGLALGFEGKTAQIARVHHYGLRERLNGRKERKGPLVKFAERQLIGIARSDKEHLEEMLLEHVSQAGPHS